MELVSGEQLQAPSIVVATDGPTAARLVGELQPPNARDVTCLYFAAEKPPIDEPILLLDAERTGPVNNMCVPSAVAESYAPAGAVLVSVTVLEGLHKAEAKIERDVRD